MFTQLIKYAVLLSLIGYHPTLSGQQLPHSLRLADLPMSYNPAAFPTGNSARLLLQYQNQFVGGRSDLSNNASATFHSAPFGKKRSWGVGFRLLRDKAQDFYQTNVRAGIGVRLVDVRPRRKVHFSWNLGVFWGALLSRFDHRDTDISQIGDPVLQVANNLNELDAGMGTRLLFESQETEFILGATVVQFPQNWSSNGERGLNREPHIYVTASALFPLGPNLRGGPAFTSHWMRRSDLGIPDYLRRSDFFQNDNQQFVELGMRFRLEQYESGGYFGYRQNAKSLIAGFDVALLSKKTNRQGLSLAVHAGIPCGDNRNLGPMGEVGLLWEWD